MNNITKQQLIDIYKALSDTTRLEIVQFLLQEGEYVGCCKILSQFALAQPTLSHHCNKLVKAGIIHCRKDGTAKYYTINRDLLGHPGILSETLLRSLL